MKRSARLVCCVIVFLSSVPALVSQERPEKVDLDTVSRIPHGCFHNSQVMTFASGLMDSIGERLTGSPNMKRANEWTRDTLTEIGLENAHLEDWGEFGMGWQQLNTWARMV